MNNFDLTKYLAEGKLHEFISAQDTEDIAGMIADEFTKESADEGDYLRYSVGKVEGQFFELDTEATDMSSEDLDMRGVGEGWGGNFSIKPKGEGYEVRNGEKGGLVAIIDNMGNFKMLSADESRAEMGRAKGEETDYMERRKETSDYMEEGAYDNNHSERMAKIKQAEEDRRAGKISQEEFVKIVQANINEGEMLEKEVEETKSNKMKKSELKEMIKAAMMAETSIDEAEKVEVEDDENVDVDIEKDIEVDDESSEVDVDIEASMPGESADVEEVQALLMKAQEQAKDLGDEKLTDQIGNTITYFTRAHVSRVDEMSLDIDGASDAELPEMEAELGLEEAKDEEVKENLNESVTFPMWNKIK